MACRLCGKETGYFGSKKCDKCHRVVHKACLEKSCIKFRLFEDCRSCIKKFLMNLKQSATCIKCKSNLEFTKTNCKSYKNLCAKCIPKFIKRVHYDKCKVCKTLCKNLVFSCTSCKELRVPKDFLKIPRCINQHKYCKECIKIPGIIINDCPPCSLYFELLGKSDKKNEVICNLCGRFPEGNNFFCKFNHRYCKTCMIFLKNESYTRYPRVFRCSDCLDFIKTLSITENELIIPKKNEEIKYELSSEIQENHIISESKTFEITEKNKMKIQYSEATIRHNNLLHDNIEDTNNEIKLLDNTCSICGKKYDFANACGHFFCMYCLSEYVKQYVYYTIGKIVNCSNLQKIKNKFILPCCYENCRKKIVLPLNMVLSEMTVGPKTEYSEYIYQFNPYLEGMRTVFIRCACNSVVGIVGSVRMNCKCSRQ
ncbi:hypothetical protein SteCoe_22166 [Stentor coeruleus]|uniref:RING-type domain-containing protein n=1 Tax=Stentor coeruleus TaxID=5963 RepID=A0A1R2BMU3_9CILI|nr:hypothetical protein SteCoe_22166 [Stentor coeruleus]